jgi:hypothetical protein
MANGRDGGSGTAIILALVVLVLVGVVLWVTGVFGGRPVVTERTEIQIETPQAPQAPSPGN